MTAIDHAEEALQAWAEMAPLSFDTLCAGGVIGIGNDDGTLDGLRFPTGRTWSLVDRCFDGDLTPGIHARHELALPREHVFITFDELDRLGVLEVFGLDCAAITVCRPSRLARKELSMRLADKTVTVLASRETPSTAVSQAQRAVQHAVAVKLPTSIWAALGTATNDQLASVVRTERRAASVAEAA